MDLGAAFVLFTGVAERGSVRHSGEAADGLAVSNGKNSPPLMRR